MGIIIKQKVVSTNRQTNKKSKMVVLVLEMEFVMEIIMKKRNIMLLTTKLCFLILSC